jgi:hypothetical protein
MRAIERVLCVVVSLGSGVVPGFAQQAGDAGTPLPSRSVALEMPALDAVSPVERLAALERWSANYQEWRTWFAQWRSTRQPGWLHTRARRERPDPPAWLGTLCPVPADEAGVLSDGCRLFAEWQHEDLATTVIATQAAAVRARQEAPTHSVWWQHIHLDALWPMTQGTSGVFGLVGVHTTIQVSGRVQMFLAPGAILVRVPGVGASDEWKPATDWGFSYRVFNFVLPGPQRPGTLHLNLAKVWLLGRTPGPAAFDSAMYLAGFSLTFRKTATR